ncbi:GNAT family N-acetyltransferase [Arthrobacter cryoconiti]|uniref:GNAT family N-acetyltransferase n=1 Tax=Arthrobacter cryoconiti TaxID=748907 RepID=A0ABV8R0K6_9MICC|nr:GNAT family N-acetyltransferase [Arthrobacter cryoconiti]MCC9069193.1 GNAT family N-acetyltransferase [Arthrobacter cryoconiti]
MSEIRIEQLRVPDALDSESAGDFRSAVEVSRAVRIETWGNDDLAYTAEEMLALCHDPYEWYVALIARLDGEIVARAGIAMPLDEETDLAHVTLDVLPSAQGHGLGRELLEAAEVFVRGENRRIVMVETNHAATWLGHVDEDALPAASGVGSLPVSSREARFAHNAGYGLERVEQFSSCAVPLDSAGAKKLSEWAREANGGGYALHQWTDRCPKRWAADFVRLENSTGNNGEAGEIWDETKLRESEELSLQTGRHTLVSAAECLATGHLVAFTSISVLGARADIAFQDETVVQLDHRGRELGLDIKVANLELLAREFPGVGTVYTWNAADNEYMLSVNAKLGFAPAGITGQWQKNLENVL